MGPEFMCSVSDMGCFRGFVVVYQNYTRKETVWSLQFSNEN